MQYNESFIDNTLSFANCIRTADGGTHLVACRLFVQQLL
ncbi:MAG: hypothetical protein CBC30_00150 [Chloroflexi bacterium TMED70]|nr:MAG: hypothetical protein CBC30_00150 [Chloroflexi bacterium TMED70]